MDIVRARKIMEILADGINPETGEVLPPEDSCNQPEVIRAFHMILSVLPENPRKSQPENAGKPWTWEDDCLLSAMYDEGKPCKEICEYFKRSTGGIAARLVQLGKIPDRETFRRKMKEK